MDRVRYFRIFIWMLVTIAFAACAPAARPTPTVAPSVATIAPTLPEARRTATFVPTLPILSPTFTATPRPVANQAIVDLLNPIRQKYKLPALAGGIVTSKGLIAVGATGVRKAGTNVAVTTDDLWHLGSDTKAMTATLIGDLIEQGKIKWDSTLAEVFPELAAGMNPEFRKVTVLHLLSHRAGLPHDLDWDQISRTGNLRQQREQAVKIATAVAPLSPIGTQFEYSNVGFVIAGAMAERVMNESWENLITQLLFRRLGMDGAGFGGIGMPGQIDPPWPHDANGIPTPKNGPTEDNLPVMGPAGTVHASLADWSNFIADQIRGSRGESALLKAGTYQAMHTPPFGGDYASGWGVAQRDWGGGTVFSHAGSNTINYAVVWMAPLRDFAVLVVTNQGGDAGAGKACDDASGALIQYFTSR
jgi:CubicO group peptidase (beta-lactamase class C family)